MKKRNDTFIVALDDEDNVTVLDEIEMSKYADKARVDPKTGSKQMPPEGFMVGKNLLDPKYNPYHLVELLDLYGYHESCVDAVATDAAGVAYSLNPIPDVEPVEHEKKRFTQVLDASTPSINTHIRRMIYDRRAIGYGAMEIIRWGTSKSDIRRFKHIPSHTLSRHSDKKRVLHLTSDGTQIWFVIYGKNYDENGNLCDVHADTGEFHPYNSLSPEERANELLWTYEYAPATDYYGRPPIIAAIPSIKGDLSAVAYNTAFFDNYGMPKFAVTVTGDFLDYDVEPFIEDENGNKVENPEYDETKTLRWRISQQIKQVIKHPHSAICITIPSEGEEGNVDLKITPLSVQTEEGNFRMYRKDIRDEVIHDHKVDPSRLGIFDAGNLNGTNSDNTKVSYKYGTITPIKVEAESLINQVAEEIGVKTWKFTIVDVDPVDYTKDLQLADFLFARGAMTIMDLINYFGDNFGLNVEDIDETYLNERYLNNVPLVQVWNQSEQNPYAELDMILGDVEKNLRGEPVDDDLQADTNSEEEPISSTD